MKNIRLQISCKIISCGIRLMPEDWRTKKAINNLIATNLIKNTKESDITTSNLDKVYLKKSNITSTQRGRV
tara:strand:- start:248 stop:460 length:213 start_codon:yes stop_codon:yes gene_type:complete